MTRPPLTLENPPPLRSFVVRVKTYKRGGRTVKAYVRAQKVTPHYAQSHRRISMPTRLLPQVPVKGKVNLGRPFETRPVIRLKTSGKRISKADYARRMKRDPSYRKRVIKGREFISKITGKRIPDSLAYKRIVKTVGGRKVVTYSPRSWLDLMWRESHSKATDKQIKGIRRTLSQFQHKGLDPRKSPNLKRYLDWMAKNRPLLYAELSKRGLVAQTITPTGFSEAAREAGLG